MRRTAGDIRPGSVVSGWAVAVSAGVVISLILRVLYGLITGFPIEREEFTLSLVAVSLVSGFLAYLMGGYVAARTSRRSGGANGAMVAILGPVVGIVLALILATFGAIFPEGVAMPPACFGLTGEALLAGLALFAVNLFGGYVGGKLGEPFYPGG